MVITGRESVINYKYNAEKMMGARTRNDNTWDNSIALMAVILLSSE